MKKRCERCLKRCKDDKRGLKNVMMIKSCKDDKKDAKDV